MESKPKVILFGTGQYFLDCLPFARQCFEIVAVAESDPKSSTIKEFRLLKPEQIDIEEFEHVIVMSGFVSEIKTTLLTVGVSASKIKTVDCFPQFLNLTTEAVLAKCASALPSDALPTTDARYKHIRIVINSLGGGGAEKALINLLKQLDHQFLKIDLLVLFDGETYRNAVPSHVRVSYLNDTVANTTCLKIALKHASKIELTRVFGQSIYSVDIAFLEGWATRIVGSCASQTKLAWCHTNLKTNHWTHPYWCHSLESERKCYESFNCVIFVSNDSQAGFLQLFPQYPNEKLTVIPNLITSATHPTKSWLAENDGTFYFISVGRLVPVKGFERLIKAFKSVSQSAENTKLVIIGEGNERTKLERAIAALELENKVLLPGFSLEPFSVVKADCFVSSSYTEGHPLAIAEALLNGIPVVATECGGCVEILENGQSGLLVENSETGLIKGMKSVIESESLMQNLIKAAKNSNVRASNSHALSAIQKLIDRRPSKDA